MSQIYVAPSKVWDFFQQNNEEMLKNMIPVAEDTDTDTIVYVTDIRGFMCFCVFINDELEYDETVQSYYDAQFTAEFIYNKYIGVSESEEESDEKDSEPSYEDEYEETITTAEINLREHEIQDAFEDFIGTILDPADLIELIHDPVALEELKDSVLEVISECGFLVYRPTIILDDDGEGESVVCYPYGSY